MSDRTRKTLGLARRAWRSLGHEGDRAARADLEAYVLDEVLRRPILFEDARGLRYVLRPGENARAYLEHGGNYEVAETRFCERYLEPGMTAVDVGAHIGVYTLLFARLVGSNGRVYAFEPAPANHRRLLENLALNAAENVVVEEAALFRESGRVTLNLFPEELGAWHSLGRPSHADPSKSYATIEPSSSVEVAALTLDEYVARQAIERIDLLKVDVEGAEVDVLEGARATLASRRVGAVLFEASRPQIEALGHDPASAFEALREAGLTVRSLEPDGSPGRHASRPEARYANYIALRDDGATRAP